MYIIYNQNIYIKNNVQNVINPMMDATQIKFSPSLVQLVEYSEKSLSDMVVMLKDVPRLCNTFKIPNVYLPPYSYSISVDPVCCSLQAAIDQSTSEIIVMVIGVYK